MTDDPIHRGSKPVSLQQCAALDDSDLVVEPLDEAEREFVFDPAVGGNAVSKPGGSNFERGRATLITHPAFLMAESLSRMPRKRNSANEQNSEK